MFTKLKIMDTAFRLFSEKGTEFSLSEVAAEVGIKKASIYAHFQSKEELLYMLIEKEIKEYFLKIQNEIDCFEACQNNYDFILKKTFITILEYYDSKEKLLFWKRILLFPNKGLNQEQIDRVFSLYNERFESIKKIFSESINSKLIKKTSAEVLCLYYFNLINGTLSGMLIYEDKNVKEHFNGIWEVFWDGVKA